MSARLGQLAALGVLLVGGCDNSHPVGQPVEDLAGRFFDATAYRLPAVSSVAIRATAGDVDGDGNIDLVVAPGSHTGGVPIPPQDFILLVNNGNGFFVDEAALRLPASAFGTKEASTVLLGDVDGDSDLDIYIANGVSGFVGGDVQDRLWINNGQGFFADVTATNLPAISYNSMHAGFGDVDSDGDLDIFVGVIAPFGFAGQNTLLINNGDGEFSDETSARLPVLFDTTIAVALSDLDGDADLDIIVANGSTNGSKLLINNGTGFFTDETLDRSDSLPRYASDVAVADVNGDDSGDLIFADIRRGPYLFINDGSGHFTNETGNRVPAFNYAHGIALGDVDKDGDYDWFFSAPPNCVLLQNDGAGFFVDASPGNVPVTEPVSIRYPLIVDIDDDGDPDLYLPDSIEGGLNRDLLWINLGHRG